MLFKTHYGDVDWVSWRLKILANQLLFKLRLQARREITGALNHICEGNAGYHDVILKRWSNKRSLYQPNSHTPQCTCPYPSLHHSEQKCAAHFWSELCIARYGTSALWDLWNWSMALTNCLIWAPIDLNLPITWPISSLIAGQTCNVTANLVTRKSLMPRWKSRIVNEMLKQRI